MADTEPEKQEQVAAGEVNTEDADDEIGVEELAAALEAAKAEAEQHRDQALRAQAELENVRRRTQRDVENAHKYALEKFAGELLPVVDSLEKAVEASRTAEDGESENVKAIADGVALSLKLFTDVLAKAGIEPIDPLGHPFDPQYHEAMSMVENPEAEPGSVVAVLQKGYLLNGRLLRAAKVMVAKAPEQQS